VVAPAERLDEEAFTPSMFRVIGVQPQFGHVFADAEDHVDVCARGEAESGRPSKGLVSFNFRFLQGEAIDPVSRHGRLGGQPRNYSVQRVLDQMQGRPGVAAAISQPPMV